MSQLDNIKRAMEQALADPQMANCRPLCEMIDILTGAVAELAVENTALRGRYVGDLVDRMRAGIMATEGANARLRSALRGAMLYLPYAVDSPEVQPQSIGFALAIRDGLAALPEETQTELVDIWAAREHR